MNATVNRIGFVLDSLDPDLGPYTWRVRRNDAAGRPGAWSALRSFSVTKPAPVLAAPLVNADVAPSDAVFTWTAAPRATKYRFERRLVGAGTIAGVRDDPQPGVGADCGDRGRHLAVASDGTRHRRARARRHRTGAPSLSSTPRSRPLRSRSPGPGRSVRRSPLVPPTWNLPRRPSPPPTSGIDGGSVLTGRNRADLRRHSGGCGQGDLGASDGDPTRVQDRDVHQQRDRWQHRRRRCGHQPALDRRDSCGRRIADGQHGHLAGHTELPVPVDRRTESRSRVPPARRTWSRTWMPAACCGSRSPRRSPATPPAPPRAPRMTIRKIASKTTSRLAHHRR